jgi:hypothetical protein
LSARPLFVAGCQRSGTTAFADYMNRHPRVLVGVERYGRIPAKEITPELFAFERILDYREETIRPREYYEALLSEKDEKSLKWIGDKNPNYVLRLNLLSKNNPGARFIVLHRPVEEVAESWGVGGNNSADPWRGRENGFERGVQAWNRSLNKTREFVESGTGHPVLIVSYHDFFYRNEACASLISRFLDLEFDESVYRSWRRLSADFERTRRPKSELTEEQATFVRTHKDHAAEDWVIRRIDTQWRFLEADTQDGVTVPAWITAGSDIEVRRNVGKQESLERRVGELEWNLAKKTRTVERLQVRNEELEFRARNLDEQLRNVRGSKTWRLLDGLKRLGVRVRSRGRGSR